MKFMLPRISNLKVTCILCARKLKTEVEKQINEMLEMGIIRPSKSEMASPIVCVLKGRYGKDG